MTKAMEGSVWNYLDQSCSCYLAIPGFAHASAREGGRETGLNSLKTERVAFLNAVLDSSSSRRFREIMLTVLRSSCTTLKVTL